MPRNPNAMNDLLKYIDLVVESCDDAAISSYKEQIDEDAKKFYRAISNSGSVNLDSNLIPFEEAKIDTTNSRYKIYGYQFDWSHQPMTPGAKKTWNDLAWMFNSGNIAFKGGTYFISRANHRLKGLDKRAYSRFKAKLRKANRK